MPNTLSQKALQEILAEESTDQIVECLTFQHAGFANGDVRVVNDKEDLVRAAGTFTAFPFTVQLPDGQDEQMPTVRIIADLVDRQILQELRSLSVDDPPIVTYEAVLKSQPDVVEFGPLSMDLERISSDDVNRVVLLIGFSSNFLGDQFPKDIMSPSAAQGI